MGRFHIKSACLFSVETSDVLSCPSCTPTWLSVGGRGGIRGLARTPHRAGVAYSFSPLTLHVCACSPTSEMTTHVLSTLCEVQNHLNVTALLSTMMAAQPLLHKDPKVTPRPAQGLSAAASREGCFRAWGLCSPWRSPSYSWGSSLSQPAGQQTSQNHPGWPPAFLEDRGTAASTSAFPSTRAGQTVAPTETKSTNEGKECKPNTWGAPPRTTFGSVGGCGVLLSVSKLPTSEAQECGVFSASALEHASLSGSHPISEGTSAPGGSGASPRQSHLLLSCQQPQQHRGPTWRGSH